MDSDRISPEEVNAKLLAAEPIVFIDSRNAKAWAESDQKIPDAIRVPADAIEDHLKELNKDSTVVAYCT